ncbi:MAG: hypothetical protein B1H13_11815, partial [Desulfobacteraceae bacterium 4484_190.3]
FPEKTARQEVIQRGSLLQGETAMVLQEAEARGIFKEMSKAEPDPLTLPPLGIPWKVLGRRRPLALVRPPEGQGALLYMQLEVLEQEVEKNLSGQGSVEISELASAVFEMKHQLMAGMQAQKALGINYENEEEILEKSNEITDRVLLSLIREEYQAGRISTSRLAQILRRLVPDPAELKRLLPKIKSLLLEEGMSLPEYLKLVQDLGRELQSEGLAKIIHESSEQIGVDGEEIFEEMKKNPSQAAELIYLAAEIRKGTGDENALSELLVD